MKCKNCQGLVKKGQKFCSGCGFPVPEIKDSIEKDNDDDNDDDDNDKSSIAMKQLNEIHESVTKIASRLTAAEKRVEERKEKDDEEKTTRSRRKRGILDLF